MPRGDVFSSSVFQLTNRQLDDRVLTVELVGFDRVEGDSVREERFDHLCDEIPSGVCLVHVSTSNSSDPGSEVIEGDRSP